MPGHIACQKKHVRCWTSSKESPAERTNWALPPLSSVIGDRTKAYCVDIEHFIDPFAS